MDTVPLLAQVGRLVQGRCGCGKTFAGFGRLCEVENDSVLSIDPAFVPACARLPLRGDPLPPMCWGIDVALLYQPGSSVYWSPMKFLSLPQKPDSGPRATSCT